VGGETWVVSLDEEELLEPQPAKNTSVASNASELTKTLSMRVSFPKSDYQNHISERRCRQ